MNYYNSPTIKDVARLAGVSIATVSRVLNKQSSVKKANEEKVLEAIKQLGYRPHAIAQSLKKNTTKLIGCILSDISNSYLIQVAKAIEDVISLNGYNLIMSSTQGQMNLEEKQINSLLEMNVAGMFVNTTGFNDDLLKTTIQQIPTVLLHRDIAAEGLDYDFVDSDNVLGAYELTKAVLQKGHRRIGLINGLLNVSSGRDRYKGFLKAVEEVSEQDQVVVFNGEFTTDSGYNGARFLTSLGRQITAIIAMNNNMAIGAMRYLFQQEIRIPEDLSFASYGNITNIELFKVRPVVVSLDPENIGWKVAEFLLQRIADPHMDARKFLSKPAILAGDTLTVI